MKIAVAGGTGYSGQELLKLLKGHPVFSVAASIGRETKIEELDPEIRLALLCTPNEVSLEMAPNRLCASTPPSRDVTDRPPRE